ncbi:carboxylesterase, partial [Streptomyces sp. e14]
MAVDPPSRWATARMVTARTPRSRATSMVAAAISSSRCASSTSIGMSSTLRGVDLVANRCHVVTQQRYATLLYLNSAGAAPMPFTFERVGAAPLTENATQHMVRMRDGVRLATDVYLPEEQAHGGEAFPAVLVRLPYDKNSRYVYVDRIARLFTARGYALVVQDVRGKFRSGGRTLPFLREPQDGHDSIDWIVHQTWSDGRVGMFGDSYYGFTQWAAVASQHPALRAIVPRVTAADFSTIWRPGDRPAPIWLEGIEYFAHHWVDNDTYEYELDPSRRPVIDQYEQAFEAIGARSTWFDLMAPRQAELPTQPGLHPFDARPVPVLHCVGWFDNIGAAHMRDYTELAARPGWDAVQYLWAGAID